jgi:cobalt-zinc-cadmium efflux system membrane fusion protein
MKHFIPLLLACLLVAPTPADAGGGHGHEGHEERDEHGEGNEVHLGESVLRERGVTTEVAGPARIAKVLKVTGRVGADQNRFAHIHPRFPGVVKEVRKELGDSVQKGESLVVVESNQSLKPYEVVSLTSGTVVFRHATVGEYVTESEPIFAVADLSSVWIDLFVFPRDFGLVRKGLPVRIRPPHSGESFESTVSYVSRVVDEQTQARVARAVIENREGKLYPDQFVDAELLLEGRSVPLAVRASAVQRIGERTVVFAKEGERYEARDVVAGDSDGEVTEVLAGIRAGVEYAAGNTFVLKAELGKGSVEDDD